MLLHLYWWTVTQVYNEHWIVVNWKRSLYVRNLFQQVESSPKTPACLVTINLLVKTQLGICRQAIPMVQQARDEGEANTKEGRFRGGGKHKLFGQHQDIAEQSPHHFHPHQACRRQQHDRGSRKRQQSCGWAPPCTGRSASCQGSGGPPSWTPKTPM